MRTFLVNKKSMETPSTSRTRKNVCANLKEGRHGKTKQKEMIFQRYCKETVSVFFNAKLLPEIIRVNCFGYIRDRPTQRKHDSLVRDKVEADSAYFDKIINKSDLCLVSHLTIQRLTEKHPEEEMWEAILCFNSNVESYSKDKRWSVQIKHNCTRLVLSKTLLHEY